MGEEKFAQTALAKAVQGAIAVQPQQSGDLPVATPGGYFKSDGMRTPVLALWVNCHSPTAQTCAA